MKHLLLTFFAFFFAISVTAQESVELNPVADNTLIEPHDGIIRSNGSGSHFFVGRTNNRGIRRAVLKFDLSDLPESAVIDSVNLRLFMDNSGAGAFDQDIFEVTSDWGEGASNAGGGGGTGTTPEANDATWIHTFFDTSQWNTAGGDFNSTSLSRQNIGGTGSYTFYNSAAFTALAQSWYDNPAENYGIIIVSAVENQRSSKRYASRENLTNKPVLTVYYSINPTSSEEENTIPEVVTLDQNYPNPFNPTTNISFQLPQASNIQLNVYDIVGRRVATIFEGVRSAGTHTFTFNASNLSSGVYIYTLEGTGFLLSRQFTLIK
jgi:hypothetical protein